jgi:hypothetical protein
MTVSLEALLRRASKMAEQAFNKMGTLEPIWLVETADQRQETIVVPIWVPEGMTERKYKDRQAAVMREIFKDRGVVRYARAVEAWTSKMPAARDFDEAVDLAAQQGSIANDPQRDEVVMVDAGDGREYLCALREIIRPHHGKPYLGKLGEIERPNQVSGRYLDLLPSAHTGMLS